MPRLTRRKVLQAFTSVAAVNVLASRNAVAAPSAGLFGLRAMTFNIQSGSRGLEGVARLIRRTSPDIVALQEVDRFTRRAHGKDQAEELAKLTGLEHHVHFRATDLFGGAYGVALLSRFPLEAPWHMQLPRAGTEEPRTVGRARIEVEGQTVSVYVTHLAHLPTNGDLRTRQMKAILAELQADPHPKIVMGDLNESPHSQAVRLLGDHLRDAFDTSGRGRSGTYPLPLFLPAIRLDYVMASPELQPQQSYVIESTASDHYPVVAEFELRRAAEEVPLVAATGT